MADVRREWVTLGCLKHPSPPQTGESDLGVIESKKKISLFESKCWQPLTLGGNYLGGSCRHPTKIGNKREVDMNLLLNDYLDNLSKLFRFYEYFLLSVFVETSLMVAERISPILTGMAIIVSGK